MFRRKWPIASKAYLALAAACAIAAFLMTRGYARRLEALHPVIGPSVPVVVAAVDVPRGSTISPSELELERVPSTFAPPGAFHDPGDVAGRVATGEMAAGEEVTRTRVAAPGAGPVAALVPVGLRAFTITAGTPTGEIRAGDRIDVLATYGGGHPHTETAATDLEVLLVLRASGSSATGIGPSSETSGAGTALVLLVSPDAAERLAYAQAFGDLTVAVEPP